MTDRQELFYNMTRPSVRELSAYNPGPMPMDCVRIAANENNMGVSPKALNEMEKALRESNRYPDGSCSNLREKLAGKYGLTPDGIIVGNGLDGVFTMLGNTFLSPGDETVFGELTFSAYAQMTNVAGATCVTVPMTDELALDVRGYINAITERTKMVVFCNPNNPTGTVATIDEIESVIKATPSRALFILDEAYIDFSDIAQTGMPLLKKYPNLIVCRTFSKLFGLAGLRVGWAAADPELLNCVYKVREPYNVSNVAEAGAVGALSDMEFFNSSRWMITAERDAMCKFLDEQRISYVRRGDTGPQGNFILLRHERAGAIYESLVKNKIYVRLMTFKGEKMLRVSVGMPKENERLREALLNAIQ